MSRRITVQKFGGSSVANTDRINNVAERIISYLKKGEEIVVVVSAMGDTTDELIELAKKINPHPLEREIDMLISTGEQISSALLAMALHKRGYEAISFTGLQVGIITDGSHTRAKIIKINTRRIREELKKGKIVIVAGFQGVNRKKDITTLGRGGSDLTAIALAYALDAKICEIYTDVNGIYTADPRIVPEAKKLKSITYDEILEMASLGAQVMQARSIEVAKKFNVPIHVRSSFSNEEGTMIVSKTKRLEEAVITGVTLSKNEAKITIRDVPDRPGIAAKIFGKISDEGINVDMIVQNVSKIGTTDLSFTIANSDLSKAIKLAREVSKDINAGEVSADEDIARVSVVGVGMRTYPGIAAGVFKALAEKKINIEMISTSDISISCIVKKNLGEEAVRIIHKKFKLHKINS
ncbi:MAG: aspartate kinase [Candidatus Omnitrophica bacterium]|nr:aspartate kinase [Candidatus Omnitrophota bacterium]MCM8827445.1 aspartate kinase [Candidatus Omnitrophota bacterium]